MNPIQRYRLFQDRIGHTWNLLINYLTCGTEHLRYDIENDKQYADGPLRLLNPDGGLDYVPLEAFRGVDCVWRNDGKPALRIYLDGWGFDISDVDTSQMPEPEHDPLKAFCDWYRASEDDYLRWKAWIEQPPRTPKSPFINIGVQHHDGSEMLHSVCRDDIRTVECTEGMDPVTEERLRVIHVCLNHEVREPLLCGPEDPEPIIALAKWRGVDPQVWLDWVGYVPPSTPEEDAARAALAEQGDEPPTVVGETICKTRGCEKKATYLVHWGNIAVCPDCAVEMRRVIHEV